MAVVVFAVAMVVMREGIQPVDAVVPIVMFVVMYAVVYAVRFVVDVVMDVVMNSVVTEVVMVSVVTSLRGYIKTEGVKIHTPTNNCTFASSPRGVRDATFL